MLQRELLAALAKAEVDHWAMTIAGLAQRTGQAPHRVLGTVRSLDARKQIGWTVLTALHRHRTSRRPRNL